MKSEIMLKVTDAAFFSSSTYRGKHSAKSSNLQLPLIKDQSWEYDGLPTSIYARSAVLQAARQIESASIVDYQLDQT